MRFANALAREDALLKKLVTVIAAPVPHDYFPPPSSRTRRARVVLVMVRRMRWIAFHDALRSRGRRAIVYQRRYAERGPQGPAAGLRAHLEPHHAARAQVDPTITYLQVLYPSRTISTSVARDARRFGDEVPAHLEFVRFDGKITCFGLPLVRFTTEERLDEIIDASTRTMAARSSIRTATRSRKAA